MTARPTLTDRHFSLAFEAAAVARGKYPHVSIDDLEDWAIDALGRAYYAWVDKGDFEHYLVATIWATFKSMVAMTSPGARVGGAKGRAYRSLGASIDEIHDSSIDSGWSLLDFHPALTSPSAEDLAIANAVVGEYLAAGRQPEPEPVCSTRFTSKMAYCPRCFRQVERTDLDAHVAFCERTRPDWRKRRA